MKRDGGNGKWDERECGAVAVTDSSALFYWMHRNARDDAENVTVGNILLDGYANTISDLGNFNVDHPLFGGKPVSVLVPDRALRVHNKSLKGCLCLSPLPDGSFSMLRQGLYVSSPELTFVRMANYRGEVGLAEIGTNLCGQYYLEVGERAIGQRRAPLTTREALARYAREAADLRGGGKALRASGWVLPRSGSPMETKVQLLFRLPASKGGFALPFTEMNYVVSDRRLKKLCEQSWYSIDLAAPDYKVGLEYDGVAYHQSTSHDNRRRNALKGLGWEVFPTDSAVIFDSEATERLAFQIAKFMGVRMQRPRSWERKHTALRKELGLLG